MLRVSASSERLRCPEEGQASQTDGSVAPLCLLAAAAKHTFASFADSSVRFNSVRSGSARLGSVCFVLLCRKSALTTEQTGGRFAPPPASSAQTGTLRPGNNERSVSVLYIDRAPFDQPRDGTYNFRTDSSLGRPQKVTLCDLQWCSRNSQLAAKCRQINRSNRCPCLSLKNCVIFS